MKSPKSWAQACASKNATTYRLMAQRARNRELGCMVEKNETTYMLMIHKEAKIVSWDMEQDHIQTDGTWRGRNRELGGVLEENETTYSLMSQQRGQNCEQAVVVLSSSIKQSTEMPILWASGCGSKRHARVWWWWRRGNVGTSNQWKQMNLGPVS